MKSSRSSTRRRKKKANNNVYYNGKASLSKADADKLFCISLGGAVKDAKNFVGPTTWAKLDEDRRGVITNMSYQLGGARLNKFDEFRKALQKGDYNKAAKEMVFNSEGGDSKWYTQSPARATRLFLRMIGPAPLPPE